MKWAELGPTEWILNSCRVSQATLHWMGALLIIDGSPWQSFNLRSLCRPVYHSQDQLPRAMRDNGQARNHFWLFNYPSMDSMLVSLERGGVETLVAWAYTKGE